MKDPTKWFTLTVSGGTGGGSYLAGAVLPIVANAAPSGKVFDKWTTTGSGTFADAASADTTFTMPAANATVTANFKDAPVVTYAVTVNGGTGSGNYAAGAAVAITAGAAPAGKVFDKWTTADGVTFGDANNASTTFTMPGKAVTVTATFKDPPPAASLDLSHVGWDPPADLSELTVSVTSNVSWTASSNATWLTVSPASGTNNGTLTVKAAANTGTTARSGMITVMGGGITCTVVVTQAGATPPPPIKTIFSTRYESNFFNWFMFIVLFGFIWMWFI